jgi:hypothetical protein
MNGDVTITLGGREAVLKCTLGAAMKVDEELGGFAGALQAVSTFRLSAFVCVVAAGLGKPQQDVREAVFKEGLTNLIGPVSEYLALLTNGGRKADEVKEAAKTGEG